MKVYAVVRKENDGLYHIWRGHYTSWDEETEKEHDYSLAIFVYRDDAEEFLKDMQKACRGRDDFAPTDILPIELPDIEVEVKTTAKVKFV